MFQTGNQLKGYIQSESKTNNISSNSGYNYYFTREFLQKLYNLDRKRFVLKGSYSQFVNLGKIVRPITDIDIVTFDKFSLGQEQINTVINESKEIKFKILSDFMTTNSTLNYKILCDFDGKTGRISIDFKKEEVEDSSLREMPVFFSKDKVFTTQVNSLEKHLADKLFVVLLHLRLSAEFSKDFRRFKDFFDIYRILSTSVVDEKKVMELLEKRIKEDEFLKGYSLTGPFFTQKFVEENKTSWKEDKKKYQFLTEDLFEDVVEKTNDFLRRK